MYLSFRRNLRQQQHLLYLAVIFRRANKQQPFWTSSAVLMMRVIVIESALWLSLSISLIYCFLAVSAVEVNTWGPLTTTKPMKTPAIIIRRLRRPPTDENKSRIPESFLLYVNLVDQNSYVTIVYHYLVNSVCLFPSSIVPLVKCISYDAMRRTGIVSNSKTVSLNWAKGTPHGMSSISTTDYLILLTVTVLILLEIVIQDIFDCFLNAFSLACSC